MSTQPTRPFKCDVRVTWKDDYRPTAVDAGTAGCVFASKGRTTVVLWDGDPRPAFVFTGALCEVK